MSRILQGTSRLLQVDTSLLLQGILQFSLTLTCPHGLTTTCWLLKASSTCLQGFFSWLHGFKASLLGFMASRLLHLASWLQGFFTWLHGFNTISRLLYLASWLQGLFTWLHGFKASSLGFMASSMIVILNRALSTDNSSIFNHYLLRR
jgi:hypothetical protein